MKKFAVVAGLFSLLVLVHLAGGAQAQTRRPFDDYTPPSSVSPYLNLTNNNSNNNSAATAFLNYQLLVKPQLEQRKLNRQSAAALHQLQQQKQQARPSRYQPTAESNPRLRSTGHVATRGNYSHYYPGLNRQQQ